MNTPYFSFIMSAAVMSRLSHWFLTILHQSSNEKCFSVCFTFSIHHNPYIHNFLIWEFTAIYELFFCCPTPLETRMLVEKKRSRGVNGPYRFSLRGSDYGFTRPRKNPRTLAHAREGQALRRAQRGDFFTPRTKNSLYMGIEPGRGGATGRPRPTELATLGT